MLEDLNRNQEVERRRGLERQKICACEQGREGPPARDELVERFLRDVESVKREPSVDQRQVVAAVTAANVEPNTSHDGGVGAQGREDLVDERKRMLLDVAARPVLGVPARRDEVGAQASPFSRIVFSSHSQM